MILAQNHHDLALGGKGYIAGRIAKRFMGIQDDDKDAYMRDTISTSIWKRDNHLG